MKELEDIIKAWRALPADTPVVLATVVATSGSTYRRTGARMLLTEDTWLAGSISGGCLEGDVLKTAWNRTEDGPALLTYDSTSADDIVWGFGLGCNGVVQVLFQRLSPDGGPLKLIEELYSESRRGILTTVISEGAELASVSLDKDGEGSEQISRKSGTPRYQICERLNQRVLMEYINPPQRLVIFGAGHDAVPVVHFARQLGWKVTLVDARANHLGVGHFPEVDDLRQVLPSDLSKNISMRDAVAVVMTHNYLQDREILRFLLTEDLPYIGLLGPRARGEKLMHDLGYTFDVPELAHVYSPIGLNIGAEGPDEIALSIISEIQCVLKGAEAGFTRYVKNSIHQNSKSPLPKESETTTCQFSA